MTDNLYEYNNIPKNNPFQCIYFLIPCIKKNVTNCYKNLHITKFLKKLV